MFVLSKALFVVFTLLTFILIKCKKDKNYSVRESLKFYSIRICVKMKTVNSNKSYLQKKKKSFRYAALYLLF